MNDLVLKIIINAIGSAITGLISGVIISKAIIYYLERK